MAEVEWLEELSEQEHDRVVVLINRLAALGFEARMLFSPSLGQGLFELRFILGSTARRVTYRFTKDVRIVLLTTFRKQRNSERAEIERTRNQSAADATGNP